MLEPEVVVGEGSQPLPNREVCSAKSFAEMSDAERVAALRLGWTEASWEEGDSAPFERP